MRDSISNTAEFGDLTRGPRLLGPEVRERMKKILSDIQSGSFAKDWIQENQDGCANFNRLREKEKEHQVESVGQELRGMMSWLQKKEPEAKKGTKTARTVARA